MRHIVIGDVHGCMHELTDLFDKLAVTPDDHLIFLGDLIHKGKYSQAVVIFVKSLATAGLNVDMVLGNHEEKHLRWLKREEEARMRDGRPNNMKHVGDYPDLELLDQEWEFLRNSSLFVQFKSGDGDFICVHGGITPGMQTLPDTSDLKQMRGKPRKLWAQMLRTRYIRPSTGKMVSLGSEQPEDVWWAEAYDGRFGYSFFGHQPYMQDNPEHYKHASALDLGVVYGGRLCAAIVEDGTLTYVSVPARKTYAARHNAANRRPSDDG